VQDDHAGRKLEAQPGVASEVGKCEALQPHPVNCTIRLAIAEGRGRLWSGFPLREDRRG
jgi:hypothetical protein